MKNSKRGAIWQNHINEVDIFNKLVLSGRNLVVCWVQLEIIDLISLQIVNYLENVSYKRNLSMESYNLLS